MADLAQRTHVLASARTTQSVNVCVKPLADASRFNLRLRGVDVPTAERDVAAQSGALHLGLRINRCIGSNGLTIARLGPDEWLLLGVDDASRTIGQRIGDAM